MKVIYTWWKVIYNRWKVIYTWWTSYMIVEKSYIIDGKSYIIDIVIFNWWKVIYNWWKSYLIDGSCLPCYVFYVCLAYQIYWWVAINIMPKHPEGSSLNGRMVEFHIVCLGKLILKMFYCWKGLNEYVDT